MYLRQYRLDHTRWDVPPTYYLFINSSNISSEMNEYINNRLGVQPNVYGQTCIVLKWNATVTMNRAPMINQNITFHLPKYNSNMFCVLKVITDKLTLLCLTMYSAIFLQSLLWDLNQMTSDVHTRCPGGLHHKHHARGRREGGREGGGAEGAEGNFTWGRNWSNVLIPMKVRHWRGGGREGKGGAEGRQKILPGGAELIKCIDPNEGEALRRGAVERGGRGRDGWKGGEGQGRRGGRKFYLGGAGFPAGFHFLGGGGVEGLWRGVA